MSTQGLGCVETFCRKCEASRFWSGGIEEPFFGFGEPLVATIERPNAHDLHDRVKFLRPAL